MFVKKQATINDDVLDYTNDLEDRIESGFDDLLPTITRFDAVSPATGFVELIRHGDIIYLSGNITFTNSGQRLINIPSNLSPKNGFYVSGTVLGGVQITNFGGIVGWGAAGQREFDGISWSIANK